jgi:iron complex outermembrane receptor protein
MRRTSYFGSGSAAAIALTLGLAAPAFAQTPATADQPAEVEEVVVTGSLIRGTPEDAALPVDVIGAEELQRQGAPSTVEMLKALPVSSGVLGDTNQFDPRAQGSEGSGSVNLRGLGAQRTLVLLNSRRMVINPFGQAGAGIVDTNLIPMAAIGRVEVLKDGAASTYGSDAIGGVVNFITRQNFDGLEASGSYRYVDGSDGDYTGSVAWGWASDKANVLLTGGYQHRSELPTTERSWANQPYLNNPEGGWSGGNGIAPFLPVYSPAPGVYAPAAGFKLDSGCETLGGVAQGGALPACLFHYIPYDNIVEEENRYQLYGEVNANLTDSAKLHLEVLYSNTNVPHWKTSPSYLALQTPTNVTNPTVGTLTPAVLAGYFVPIANPGLQLYIQQNPGVVPVFANGVHIPGVRYRPYSVGGNPMFDHGPSEGERDYKAWRVSGGIKGDWSNGISYDVALTYAQDTGVRTGYDTVVDRFQLALRGYGSLDSDPNGCTAAETNNFTTGAGNASLGCYWFNPFSNAVQVNTITGQTNPNFSATLANDADLTRWFFQLNKIKATTRLFVADAVISGKTGFTLPGGEVAWALGAQYRRDFFTSTYNELTNLAATPCVDTVLTGTTSCAVKNGPMMFLGGGRDADLQGDVYALFGELSVPVTDDLQLQLAARYEDYGGAVGSTFNPKISGRWQIVPWFALRASAGTTFRGPPLTQLDPSSVTALSFIAGSFRAIDIFGNPTLAPEKAKTYSVGGIFNVASRLKATIDWWRFDFDNPIIAEPSASIVNTMFPGNSSVHCGDPAFAGLQSRFTFQTTCGVTGIARVKTLWVNGPGVKTSGIDLMADYDVGNFGGGEVKVGGTATYTLDYKVDAFTVEGVVVEPAFDAAGLLNYQLGPTSLPKWKGAVYGEYSYGPHNVRWTVNYVDSYTDQRVSTFEGNNPVSGVPIRTGKKIDHYITHNVTYRTFLPWDTTLVLSVDNVFDEDPPFARLDLNYDPFTGSALGRTYKVSVTKKF